LRESEDASPAEVLRTKRLEIVDDKGEVRALLGTREEGVGGLSVYDASGRVRIRLEAGELPDQGSGLSVLDTDGNPRVVVNMNNDPDKDSALILLDTDGKQRAVVNLHASGQAGLSLSAGQKDRSIKLVAMDDGGVHLMLTGEGAPKAVLTSLSEDDIDDPAAILALLDKDGQGGVHIGGRRYLPFARFKDPRGTVRTSYELGVNGEPELYVFDEEGTSVRDAGTFDRLVAERGSVYQ
jgi:hypothetical protein